MRSSKNRYSIQVLSDVTSNRKCNFFVFIDIFKSCIILRLIFQQSFNYHERL